MKYYKCKLCGKEFGIRKKAREHIRVEHEIKSDKHQNPKSVKKNTGTSPVTAKCESIDFENN